MKRKEKADKASPPHRTTIFLSVLAIIISLLSSGNSIYQTIETRKINRVHVIPDVQCVIRHDSRYEKSNEPLAAELIVWNHGPIKAVSVTMSYRVYSVEPKTLKILVSMGIPEDLSDYSILQSELSVGQRVAKNIAGAGPFAVFVVRLAYYRESDMEKFTREDYFFFENDLYFDHQSFMQRPEYETIMKNLQRKIRAEALRPIKINRQVTPDPTGKIAVNWDFCNLNEDGSWTNGIGTNEMTITPVRPINSLK